MFFRKKRKPLYLSRKYKIKRSTKYKNPYLAKRRELSFKWFRIVNVVLVVGLFLCVYFFLLSDFFKITNIEISGNQVIASQDMLEVVEQYMDTTKLYIFSTHNIFIFNKRELLEKIQQRFIVDDITIVKVLPNSVKLEVKEKIATMYWHSGDKKYIIDTEGTIIKELYNKQTRFKILQLSEPEEEENKKIPIIDNGYLNIQNQANDNISVGTTVITGSNIQFIQNLYNKIANKTYTDITAIFIPHNYPQSVIFQNAGEWDMFFNLNDDLDKQILRLETLINDKIGIDNINRLDYIDLKLGESVYYKFK